MSGAVFISAKAISLLKKKAKSLRSTGLAHVELLDRVARENGFSDWHHVTLAEKNTLDAEERLKASLHFILPKIRGWKCPKEFRPAPDVPYLRMEELVAMLRDFDKDSPNGPPPVEALRRQVVGYTCMQYAGLDPLPAAEEFSDWFEQFAPWAPMMFFLNGKLFSPSLLEERAYEPKPKSIGEYERPPKVNKAELKSWFAPKSGEDFVYFSFPPFARRGEFNWCRKCERTQTFTLYRVSGEVLMCPYPGCKGTAKRDLIDWLEIQKWNPTYGPEPVTGARYPFKGRNSEGPELTNAKWTWIKRGKPLHPVPHLAWRRPAPAALIPYRGKYSMPLPVPARTSQSAKSQQESDT